MNFTGYQSISKYGDFENKTIKGVLGGEKVETIKSECYNFY